MVRIDEMFTERAKLVRELGFASKGDRTVITAVVFAGKPRNTNLPKVETID